mgnify:CR=1 FL=1
MRDVHGAAEDHRRAHERPDIGLLGEQEKAEKRVPDQRQEADRLQQGDVGNLVAALLADVAEDLRENMELELAAQHEQESGGVQRAIEIGVVDSVIEPNKTRSEIARAIAAAPYRRGAHSNIPL